MYIEENKFVMNIERNETTEQHCISRLQICVLMTTANKLQWIVQTQSIIIDPKLTYIQRPFVQ